MQLSLPITRVRIDPSGQVLAVARGASLLFFNASTGTPIPISGNQHSGKIRSITFAKSGKLLVSAGDDKQVIVWAHGVDGWKNIACVQAPKKPTSAELSALDEKTLVFADKLGDVLQVPITISPDFREATISAQPQIILGHYSSISSMTLSTDAKFIITGDKDEHVRVSHYPVSFDIQSFCLGHTEFISGFVVSRKNAEVLVSGSGDGTLKLWRMSTGTLLDSVFIGDNKDKRSEDADTVVPLDLHEPTQTIVVGVEEKAEVYLFNISAGGDKLVASGSLQLKAPIGSASFDPQGNIWASYLPIDKLHQHLAKTTSSTSTSTEPTPSPSSSSASSSSTPSATSSTSSSSSSSSSSTTESKLVFMKMDGGKYHVVEDSACIAAINKQSTDTVDEQEFYTFLHEISRNFQFRKRFGDGEFALGNNFNNAENNKGGKKGKKAKLQKEKTEKGEKGGKGEKGKTNPPIVPNFVPKSNE